ncbi:PepSY-associated TM helix domain-containing protein [Henriciella sp. AS95]|uniref:PepSY-associated TM helix domain-containing protein n=1 Tax=Henriciella sp. AS95 TaxID=3135782 RepID=UPI00317BA813
MSSVLPSNVWLFLHRWFGVLMAVFLFLAAVTGSVLTARATLDRWINSDLMVYSGAVEDRIDAIEAVSLFEAQNPDIQVVEFPLNPHQNENIPLKVVPKPGQDALDFDEVFIDPVSGTLVGTRSTQAGLSGRQFIPLLLGFHENLLLGNSGRIFLGFIALGWLLTSLIGLYLTFPKRGPFFRKWKSAWTYSPKRRFARQMLDIHQASGLWLFAFVVIVAFTSVALNFFFEFWAPFAETIAPTGDSYFDQAVLFPEGVQPDLSFQDALGRTREQIEAAGVSWQPATMLYYPDWNLYGATLTDNGVLNYKALGPIYYHFDGSSGAYIQQVNPYDDSTGLALMRSVYPLHSGEVGGPVTVFIVFLTGLATAEMCVTGIWVWLKKRGPRIAAKKKRLAADNQSDA